jgi:hypothetical protein
VRRYLQHRRVQLERCALHSAYVVTIPRSAISHDRTFCGSAPSSGVNVVMAVG